MDVKCEIDEWGTKRWYNEKGEPHREDGPAVELVCGDKYWLRNGELHREDGPAVCRADGVKEWWFDGQFLDEEEFLFLQGKEESIK
jgi:hypothetical protein